MWQWAHPLVQKKYVPCALVLSVKNRILHSPDTFFYEQLQLLSRTPAEANLVSQFYSLVALCFITLILLSQHSLSVISVPFIIIWKAHWTYHNALAVSSHLPIVFPIIHSQMAFWKSVLLSYLYLLLSYLSRCSWSLTP